MKSKRIISYIGLWALIMPWLGFSWNTKTVLFSLTGILLLYIGNKHYHEVRRPKKIEHIDNSSKVSSSPEIIPEQIFTEPEPEFIETVNHEPQNPVNVNVEQFQNNFTETNHFVTEQPKTVKPKRKLEIISRSPKKTTIKAISFDSLENNNG